MTAILQNALGFLIQLYPCEMMIFLPFPQEAYRRRRAHIVIGLTAGSVIFAFLFASVVCLRDLQRYPKHMMISNSFMSAAILISLAAHVWLVRERLVKKLLAFFIVLFYAVTQYVMVNLLHPVVFPARPDADVYPYPWDFLLLYAVATAVLVPLMIGLVLRPFREYIQQIEPRNMNREFLTATFSTLVYFSMVIYCDTVIDKIGYLHYFLPPLAISTLNQILIFWLIFQESVRRKQDSDRQRAMELQQLQYEKIVGDMESTRRMHHDLRHHFNALNGMLEQNRLDEAKNYLSTVAAASSQRINEVYCQNLAVNGLLQYYAGLARDEQIRCDIQAECGELSIEPVDLTVLFGNAMENAINACRQCPANRWISVQVGTVQGSLAIEISNACQGVRLDKRMQTQDGFLPAEAFGSRRGGTGCGLRSISLTAHKYGGSAKFRFNAERETFTARIRLNLHQDL